ncbi:vesicle-associated membrane protein 1 isoform X2 [Neopsephotus bourkii]|uniref:vesicle-associated membrane protein 1 isoform X2 n=1 Tax=Neopsephotus bourkii TaxID=309878 RepID=UPI002AA54450|nr:vesicle-associated membrane protein 1 isoform X2 [Neopsephotus bourkii]
MSEPTQQPAPGAPEEGAPGGAPAGPPPNQSSNRRLQQTQAQVKEVVDIMCVNVDKVLERDEKLSELDDRADALQAGASQFESSAAKLKRKYWWKNCKMMIMMGVIGAIVVVVIARPHGSRDAVFVSVRSPAKDTFGFPPQSRESQATVEISLSQAFWQTIKYHTHVWCIARKETACQPSNQDLPDPHIPSLKKETLFYQGVLS